MCWIIKKNSTNFENFETFKTLEILNIKKKSSHTIYKFLKIEKNWSIWKR